MANPLEIILNLRANTSGFDSGMNAARSAATALAGALAAIGLGLSAKEFIDIADATQQMASRLKNATDSTAEYNEVQARLLKLANSTYRPLAEAQEVYLSTASTMKSLGYSTEQILSVTESLSLSFTHNATRADQAQAAQDALSKAMAKGSVDADAWASIITGADNVVGDLARSTGRTESEVRSLGANGKISINELTNALIQSKDRNQELADAMSTSTADGIQKLKNNVTALIGGLNEQYDITGKLSGVLVTMADNLDWVGVLFEDAIALVDEWANSFDAIDPSVINALKDSLSTAYDALKQILSTSIELSATMRDMIGSAVESFAAFVFGVDDAGDSVNLFAAAIGTVNTVVGFLSDGLKGAGIALNLLIGIGYKLSEWAYELLSIIPGLGDRFENLAKIASEQSIKYLGKAHDQAMAFESEGLKAIENAVKTNEQRNQEKIDSNRNALEEIAKAEAEAATKQLASDATRKKLTDDLNAAKISGNQTAIDSITAAIKVLDKTEDDLAKENAKRAKTKEKAVLAYAEATITANAGIVSEELKAQLGAVGFSVAVDDAGKVAVTALKKVEDAAANVGPALKRNAEEAAKALGLDLAQSATGVSGKFTELKSNVDKVADGLGEMGYKGQEASNVIYDALTGLLSKAKTKEEVEIAKQAFIEFGDKGQLSVSQVEQGLTQVSAAAKKLPPDLNTASGALQALGVDSGKFSTIFTSDFTKASDLVKTVASDFKGLRGEGVNAQEALGAALDELLKKAQNQREIDEVRRMYVQFGNDGRLSAQQVEDGLDAIAEKLDKQPEHLDRASKAAKQLGFDLKDALNLPTREFEKQEVQLQKLVSGLSEYSARGIDTSLALVKGLQEITQKAGDNHAELDRVKQMYIKFGDQGRLSADQVKLGIDGINDSLDKSAEKLDATTQAFERLGIKTRDQLNKAAESAIKDFETVKNSGQATNEQLEKAFSKVSEAARLSGNQQKIAWIESQGAAIELGDTVEVTATRMSSAMVGVTSSITGAVDALRKAAQEAEAALDGSANAYFKYMDTKRKADAAETQAKRNEPFASSLPPKDAMTGYTQQEVYDKLVAIGYDQGRAKAKSSDLMSAGTGGSTNNVMMINELIKKLDQIENGSQKPIVGGRNTGSISTNFSKDMQDLATAKKALEKFGIVGREEQAKMAAEYRTSFLLVEKSGLATAESLKGAFEKYAVAAIAANNGVIGAQLAAEASARGYTLEASKSGKYEVYGSSGISAQNLIKAPASPTANIDSTLNKLAQSTTGQPAKNVNLKIDIGGVQAYIPTTQSGSDQAEALFRHLEDLKKGMY